MVSQEQFSYVTSLIQERHTSVIQDVERLIEAFARVDQKMINDANITLIKSLENLQNTLAIPYWPGWLKQLQAHCENYRSNHSNGVATWKGHLQTIIDNYESVKNEGWEFSRKKSEIFDADEIIEKAQRDNCIQELFDKVIEALKALLSCEEVDSIKAYSDISSIISSLESAKTGSFSSQLLSWGFARRLIPNIISSYIKRSAVIGSLVEGFEQTANELDISLAKAKDDIGQSVIDCVGSVLKTDSINHINSKDIRYLEEERPI